MALEWNQMSARRLKRAALTSPYDGTPADVVAAMCGAHAQVTSAAELSVALRLGGGVTRTDIREDGGLVKTFGPRGTVHLLPGRDLPWWATALSAVPSGGNPMPEPARMTQEQTEGVVVAIGEALLDAEQGLTVDELTEQVVARAGAWAGDLVMPAFQQMWPRWRQAISLAARRGVLCFGRSPRGRKVTYTHPRHVLPAFRPAESEQDALTELVRRYLYAYGPATPQNFALWLTAPKRWAAELFASIGGTGHPLFAFSPDNVEKPGGYGAGPGSHQALVSLLRNAWSQPNRVSAPFRHRARLNPQVESPLSNPAERRPAARAAALSKEVKEPFERLGSRIRSQTLSQWKECRQKYFRQSCT